MIGPIAPPAAVAELPAVPLPTVGASGANGRPVKVRDYMYSRKGAPPIMVKAHHRGLPNSKAADVTPTGTVIGA
jgi:hypothetical protein